MTAPNGNDPQFLAYIAAYRPAELGNPAPNPTLASAPDLPRSAPITDSFQSARSIPTLQSATLGPYSPFPAAPHLAPSSQNLNTTHANRNRNISALNTLPRSSGLARRNAGRPAGSQGRQAPSLTEPAEAPTDINAAIFVDAATGVRMVRVTVEFYPPLSPETRHQHVVFAALKLDHEHWLSLHGLRLHFEWPINSPLSDLVHMVVDEVERAGNAFPHIRRFGNTSSAPLSHVQLLRQVNKGKETVNSIQIKLRTHVMNHHSDTIAKLVGNLPNRNKFAAPHNFDVRAGRETRFILRMTPTVYPLYTYQSGVRHACLTTKYLELFERDGGSIGRASAGCDCSRDGEWSESESDYEGEEVARTLMPDAGTSQASGSGRTVLARAPLAPLPATPTPVPRMVLRDRPVPSTSMDALVLGPQLASASASTAPPARTNTSIPVLIAAPMATPITASVATSITAPHMAPVVAPAIVPVATPRTVPVGTPVTAPHTASTTPQPSLWLEELTAPVAAPPTLPPIIWTANTLFVPQGRPTHEVDIAAVRENAYRMATSNASPPVLNIRAPNLDQAADSFSELLDNCADGDDYTPALVPSHMRHFSLQYPESAFGPGVERETLFTIFSRFPKPSLFVQTEDDFDTLRTLYTSPDRDMPVPAARLTLVQRLGAVCGLLFLMGQYPGRIDPTVFQYIIHDQNLHALHPSFVGEWHPDVRGLVLDWIEAGSTGDITRFETDLVTYLGSSATAYEERTEGIHSALGADLLYRLTIGNASPHHREWQAFRKGFELGCPNGFNLSGLIKSFVGGSEAFLSVTATSNISDPNDFIRNNLRVTISPAHEANWTATLTQQRGITFKALFENFVRGEGSPCPGLFEGLRAGFSPLIDLSRINTPGFRGQMVAWAATGSPLLSPSAANILVEAIADDHEHYAPDGHEDLYVSQGIVLFRTCARMMQYPASYVLNLAMEQDNPGSEPATFQDAYDHWMLTQCMMAIGRHSMA